MHIEHTRQNKSKRAALFYLHFNPSHILNIMVERFSYVRIEHTKHYTFIQAALCYFNPSHILSIRKGRML